MGIARSFLDKFLDNGGNMPKVNKLSKNTIHHDHFDREDYEGILEEMQTLGAAHTRITDVAKTGAPLLADAYFGLKKAKPIIKSDSDVRPSHLINRAVSEQALALKEFEELRLYSVGDEVAAGMATAAFEPKLEALYDKLKTEQESLEELEEMMMEMQALQDEEHDLDDMAERAMKGDVGEKDQKKKDGPADYQEQKERIREQMEMLKKQMESKADSIDNGIKKAGVDFKQIAKKATDGALEQAQNVDGLASTWGLDPGALQKLPPDQRIEMAQRMNNPKFRRIADLIGPMLRLALAEQMRKTDFSREEVYEIEEGSDIPRVLPVELAMLDGGVLELLFFLKLLDNRLLQYKLQGNETVAKGRIIVCEDGSGSMSGEREIWAKAVSLCLLHIAKRQKRGFYGIHFGGTGAIAEFDFNDTENITLDQVIEWAETFFNGGTDFMTPLSCALDLLTEEYEREGKVSGDIVFITDGQCGVDEEWLADLKAKQETIGFRIWGIAIGGEPSDEPLNTICDGKVFTITDLLEGGEGLRTMFRAV